MTHLPTPDQHATFLSIGNKEYTQDQIAELAFKCYRRLPRTNAGYETWKQLVWPNEYTEKDWFFLALYFLSEVASNEVREAHAEDLEYIKKTVREDTSPWEKTD